MAEAAVESPTSLNSIHLAFAVARTNPGKRIQFVQNLRLMPRSISSRNQIRAEDEAASVAAGEMKLIFTLSPMDAARWISC